MAKGKNVLKGSYHDDRGRERPDPNPVVDNIDLRRSESTDARIQRILNSTLSKRMLERGEETFEESNDFDVYDEFERPELESKYTVMKPEFLETLSDTDQPDPGKGDPPKGSPPETAAVEEPAENVAEGQ